MSGLGKVCLAGAGPGDPELLTVKALRALQQAEVVLYDRLANPALLDLAPASCERICVGKEDGHHAVPQEQINALLLEHARRGRRVVRLKGGDPFVFGRGGEEALCLAEHGVPFEVIPGVSSALAAAGSAGIPVTHRNVAASFAVITGHRCDGAITFEKWECLGALDTLVFLMGVGARVEIARRLIEAGRPVKEPVAFVERATTAAQHTVVSTLGEVAAGRVEVRAPAVMVVGEVVRLREALGGCEQEVARARSA